MKPNLKDAPSWANYVAMDENGEWYWFENRPKIVHYVWHVSEGKFDSCRNNWEETLQSRPE